MAKQLTFEEKLKMAEIYKEANLQAINPKSFQKYRNEWHKERKGR